MNSWYRLDGATVILLVYTQPRASKTKVVGLHDGMLKIACCSPPVDGKANKELIVFLSRLLDCRKCDIELLRGQSSRRKQFVLTGVDAELLDKLIV
ncbi:DUF167 domain-containing protein [Desulfotalea psychrophila]|uniref:UPF0235 protein DP0789 n=1 Tax=Desulfotalea psychrophila (strain LSv54 / DSM 12343) TaxID=177439 RepID=Q6AQ55_DESPS|nr:DUF167 domain-containing protein [Desulfotalea psychrophila]CAG35518.1 hypothetical protein DP0789 [Desulfotalea psychrophila LSv54]